MMSRPGVVLSIRQYDGTRWTSSTGSPSYSSSHRGISGRDPSGTLRAVAQGDMHRVAEEDRQVRVELPERLGEAVVVTYMSAQ